MNAGSGALASYTCDGFGQHLIKTVSASYGEIYQYSQNGLLLEETNTSGVAQADYIYLNGRPVAGLLTVTPGETCGCDFGNLLETPGGRPELASRRSRAC